MPELSTSVAFKLLSNMYENMTFIIDHTAGAINFPQGCGKRIP